MPVLVLPITAGCSAVDDPGSLDDKPCVAAATHIERHTEYDARTGKELVVWRLVCEEHIDGDVVMELHEATLSANWPEDE